MIKKTASWRGGRGRNRTNHNWEDQERLVTFEMSLVKIFKEIFLLNPLWNPHKGENTLLCIYLSSRLLEGEIN